MSDIMARVSKILAENLGVSEENIKPDSRLKELVTDSLAGVEIAMAIEDEFGIRIPDDEIEKLTTVQNIVDYVSNNKK
ncbi:acyl carrier protein [Pseudomonas syringae]|uniref:acyl carrier protein n=1 Tax=Pseudomonas syringae TaxID=317 RepID=UPI0019179BD0|nr:acyl carrier protein [Pseudomonas syringae]QQQ50467.1 acyl carrier protein [Pseudomonas syringae]